MITIKTILQAALALAFVAVSTSATATGGRLNSSGCHNSKKVGHHCHRAQPTTKPAGKTPPGAAKKGA